MATGVRSATTSAIGRIRDAYGVPAFRGRRIKFEGRDATITGAQSGHMRLMIRFDGDRRSYPAHPTWQIDYLDGSGPR